MFTPRVIGTAVARYNFAARDMRELSLREGDVVRIYSRIGGDQGWWKGETNGRVSGPTLRARGWPRCSPHLVRLRQTSTAAVSTPLALSQVPSAISFILTAAQKAGVHRGKLRLQMFTTNPRSHSPGIGYRDLIWIQAPRTLHPVPFLFWAALTAALFKLLVSPQALFAGREVTGLRRTRCPFWAPPAIL